MSGITKRWFVNTILVIMVFLMVIIAVTLLSLRQYYYETATTNMKMQVNSSSISNVFSNIDQISDDELSSRGRDYINLNSKDLGRMEIWIINRSGRVLVSSNGFDVNEADEANMPDYALALESGSGRWTGRNANGEKVMAMTVTLPATETLTGEKSNGAVRFMISLEEIDSQFTRVSFLLILLCMLALGLVCFSGMFLIQSIVKPVNKINETAKLIAQGNYNASLPRHKYNDEIGELCNTFNAMAKAIGSADKMKNDFISTVSHELRTPLTAIKGWGETILDSNGSDPALVRSGLEVITGEAERLNSIVEDLLDFSKMENGRMSLKLEMIDGLAELDEAVFVFRDRAAREGITISYNAPDTPAPMHADANRIKQVFVNILDNSLKYTPQGGNIEVLATVTEQQLIVTVSDTGCGIPPDALKHVKEKFFKANVSVRGSGIGLAVCDEIMKLHDGALNISSVVDQGTTVEIILPLTTMPQQKK
ncbi:MAG: HAMP domain-containing histidine kinase [Oscillospiraceae bacterium]|jgi:signal transduction histidine kinase|nr:HAMP domain-containing histidine kinase [Oscillospiraceae bacterium]